MTMTEADASLVDGWVLWCESELAEDIADRIRDDGFQARVIGKHVYVLATEGDNIPTS